MSTHIIHYTFPANCVEISYTMDKNSIPTMQTMGEEEIGEGEDGGGRRGGRERGGGRREAEERGGRGGRGGGGKEEFIKRGGKKGDKKEAWYVSDVRAVGMPPTSLQKSAELPLRFYSFSDL